MHIIRFYQTHLTKGQWSYINKEFFENDCRKRKYSLRSIFEAVLYILVGGCQWRMLPHDLPLWEDVYYFFRKWREEGHIEHFLQKLVRRIRRKRGQHESPSVGAMDSQSVKWSNRKSINGFDGNKRVKGIKRHITVERNGFLLGRRVTHAGVHDTKVVKELCEQTRFGWERLEKLLVDRGYRGDVIADIKKDFSIEIEVSNTPNGIKGFIPKPLRWVVERTFAWLNGFRRLARNYEQTTESAEEFIDFASISILIKHL